MVFFMVGTPSSSSRSAPLLGYIGLLIIEREKYIAHEQKGVMAVYNKAEYREQRTAMLQDWAGMIDELAIGNQ